MKQKELFNRVCNAVLLFYHVGKWGKEEQQRWVSITGKTEVTTRSLCDFIRESMAMLQDSHD